MSAQRFTGYLIDCVILDELGYLPFSRNGGQLLFNALSKLGWWWHTKHDTIDKVDEAFLVRDTKIYAATVWRILTQPILPYNVIDAAKDIFNTAEHIQKTLGDRFDMSGLTVCCTDTIKFAEKFQQKLDTANESGTDTDMLNNKLHTVLTQMVRIMFHDIEVIISTSRNARELKLLVFCEERKLIS